LLEKILLLTEDLHRFFKKFRSHLKISGGRRVTSNMFRIEAPQT
jgi:hypothetical protein